MHKFYHLSHIDLDGYGCQYLTTKSFDNISCYNANYGPEVTARLEEILQDINSEKELYQEATILITDLNLTTKEANWLQSKADELGANIVLLDHHGTGESTSNRFDWYYLDTQRCATKITYDWLKENYGFDTQNRYAKIVDAINAIDIWVEDSIYFEFGKVMIGMISGARELNRVLFPNDDREYKFVLIDTAREVLDRYDLKDAPIALDDKLHFTKKEFFKRVDNDTKDNLVAKYVSHLLTEQKSNMTINYKGYKGILGYNVGNTSLIGNAFLRQNPDYDFYMDVSSRGTFSLRSNNKVDVSQIAGEIGNGGGHPNASGGKIENYKDSFVYRDLKDMVQNYLDEKSKNSTT